MDETIETEPWQHGWREAMRVVAFISGKGGVGKTTLAANVAIALAQKKKKVLLIDLDTQNALRLHLGMDPGDIAGMVREGIASRSIFKSPFGVKFIPFGIVLKHELEEFEAVLKQDPHWVRDRIFSLNASAFDFVILDTPPGASVYLQQALFAAHHALGIVLADAASFATVPRLFSLAEEYTKANKNFHGLKLVVNQISDQSELGLQMRGAMQADYGNRIVPISIHHAPAVSEALAFERPVLKYDAACKASQDIEYLADWLLTHVE